MIQFKSFRGEVMGIQDISTGEYGEGCVKMIALQNEEGAQVNFILSPATYVVNQEMIKTGDIVTGYYDGNAPTIMIYPPQYQALVMVKEYAHQHGMASYFDSELISQDHQLKLNIHPSTQITTTNGQAYTGSIANRNLVVIYGPSTKSIPAQTTPYQVIVLC
ncbi:hypothetical protein [Virgibacillus alimentarius]|uniref:hypothetical protein n=1 Tax=Virgibacillus alimentarius TaxID=698769 RepID=UPI000493A46D|nr:hypothetical protein [Virgibacillus alimentarius]